VYIYMLSCCEPLITEHEWSKMPIEYEKQAINNYKIECKHGVIW
jgi:hypothetical protein